jgi:hypothetical protein
MVLLNSMQAQRNGRFGGNTKVHLSKRKITNQQRLQAGEVLLVGSVTNAAFR